MTSPQSGMDMNLFFSGRRNASWNFVRNFFVCAPKILPLTPRKYPSRASGSPQRLPEVVSAPYHLSLSLSKLLFAYWSPPYRSISSVWADAARICTAAPFCLNSSICVPPSAFSAHLSSLEALPPQQTHHRRMQRRSPGHPRYRKDYLRAGALFDSPSLPPPKQSLILSQFSANQSYPALSGLLCAYFLLVWQSCLFGAGSALPRNAHRLTWRRESEEDKRKSGDLSWASMLVTTTPPKYNSLLNTIAASWDDLLGKIKPRNKENI